MATITKNRSKLRQFGSAPYGNLSILNYQIKTNASGALLDSNSTAAIASGDKLDLGPLPEGMSLDEAIVTVSTAMTASVTGKLGFEYEDGVDSAEVPQDDDYFFAATTLAAAAILRKANTAAPVVLPKPARLILTTGGAANAKVSQIDVRVIGELVGAR